MIKNQNEIDLIKFLQTLWRSKWLVLIVMAVILGCAFLHAQKIKPVYQAKLAIFPALGSDLIGLNPLNRSASYSLLTVNEAYDFFVTRLAERKEAILKTLQKDENNKPISLSMYPTFNAHYLIANAYSAKAARKAIRQAIKITTASVKTSLKRRLEENHLMLIKNLKAKLKYLNHAVNLEEIRVFKPNFKRMHLIRTGEVEVAETYQRFQAPIFMVFAAVFGFILACILVILLNFKSLLEAG